MSRPYTKKEYDGMVKMHDASDRYVDTTSDYVTGRRQVVNEMFKEMVSQIRTVEYILEELRSKLEEIREETKKL